MAPRNASDTSPDVQNQVLDILSRQKKSVSSFEGTYVYCHRI